MDGPVVWSVVMACEVVVTILVSVGLGSVYVILVEDEELLGPLGVQQVVVPASDVEDGVAEGDESTVVVTWDQLLCQPWVDRK